MSGYVEPDKAEILKIRIGNGDSAVDVEWKDDDLCWFVSCRSFEAWWFAVTGPPSDGYKRALRLADELEGLVQRFVRFEQEKQAAERAVKLFVARLKSPDPDPDPVPEEAPA